MRLNARSPYLWRRINQSLQEKIETQANVFLFQSMHQAIFECLLGLHLRFSHKKKLVVQSGLGDHLEHSQVELAKVGVRFKEEWDEDLDKEEKACLAYVHDLDDALTGEIYDNLEVLRQLAQRKIYRIHIAHHLLNVTQSFTKKLTDYDIVIASVDHNRTLVFTGDKVILPILATSEWAWSQSDAEAQVVQTLSSATKMFPEEIKAFEAQLPEGVQPWFNEGISRLYDRSVIYLQGYDGEAMRQLLLRELGSDVDSSYVESLSLCRWENEFWFKQAQERGLSIEQMQGSLILDARLLNEDFLNLFNRCFEQLKELSS